MSIFNGNIDSTKSIQFFVKKTNKTLIEIVDAFAIDKVKIGFRAYDQNGEKGSKLLSSIDFYMNIPEFELLCHNILSGNICARLNKGQMIEPIYKGSSRDGKMYARVLQISKGNLTLITAHEGPGQEERTGAVKPLYKLADKEHTRVMAGLTNDELKSFAIQGKRACDFYYNHYFGRQ